MDAKLFQCASMQLVSSVKANSPPVLIISPGGKILRNGVPIEEISSDERLLVIRELVALIKEPIPAPTPAKVVS